MKKKLNRYGFSMAELLMVVAILVALFGVAFVAVQNHQRSMTQLEYDTIAKEIFVAAQNHLTAAESQGYLGQIKGPSGYGSASEFKDSKNDDKTDAVYYVTKGASGQETILDLMLPFGAIDETIRAGGSYIIRYQPSSARVLDVFYSNPGPVTAWLTISGEPLDGKYANLMENFRGDDKKADRRRCSAIGGAVVGWYGDGDALPVGDKLKAPQVLIHNEETLWIEVTDTNASSTTGALVLIITGETSGAKKAFKLSDNDNPDRIKSPSEESASEEYKVILDDITGEKLHFADITADTLEFVPGENITIEAVAYNNSELTNVAYSGKSRTNSLFADPSSYEVTPSADLSAAELMKINGTVVHEDEANSVTKPTGIAAVANFRHLENLDRRVSNWGGDTKAIEYSSAIQLTNLSDGTGESEDEPGLSWESFVKKTAGTVYTTGSSVSNTNDKQYLPVNLEQDFSYFGRNHIISKITTDGVLSSTSTLLDAGVFGTLTGGSVSDLLILDSTISSSGAAGGLIGSMTGTTVERCAANGTVNSSSGAAGGLIGSASEGTVTACYSAGHTDEGSYEKWIGPDETGKTKNSYDVTGATAGGLIGASSAAISYSYSTCSVSGSSLAGGFIGDADGGNIENCYATGLVDATGETIGAFAGSYSGTAEGCLYYEIINPTYDSTTTGTGDNAVTNKTFTGYLKAVGDPGTAGDQDYDITALDANAGTYDEFVGAESTWADAVPEDKALLDYYIGSFPLRTVDQIGKEPKPKTVQEATEEGDTKPVVATHYGDWPAPEIFVINQ